MSALSIKLQAKGSSAAWQLVLDKFPLRMDGVTLRLPQKKFDALQPLITPQGNRDDLWKDAIKSRLAFLDALERQHGDRFRRLPLINSSRLLLHLGRASVLENVGLYCDRTTGLPIIPGSPVKGIISTWACWEAHFHTTDGSFRPITPETQQRRTFTSDENSPAHRILGDNSTSGSTGAGAVIFLGAIPRTPPVLAMDIVNPHHTETENRHTHEITATDNQRLLPNQFLALEAEKTAWEFAFFARPGVQDYVTLLDQTSSWLTEALTQSGLGAKTAAGYGRFRHEKALPQFVRPPEKPKSEAELAAELLALIKSPFLWGAQLQPMVKQWQVAGDTAALDAFKEAAAKCLNKLQLADLRRKSWYPQ